MILASVLLKFGGYGMLRFAMPMFPQALLIPGPIIAVLATIGCPTCHLADGTGLGPSLLGVAGHPVKLTTGETVTADDAYMRESIVLPKAKVVQGYSPIMPSFQGQMTEEQLNNVVAYLRALGQAQPKPKEEGKK